MLEILSALGLMALSVLMGFLLLSGDTQRPAKPMVDEYVFLLIIAIGVICGWRGSSEILMMAGQDPEWSYYSPVLFVFGCGLGLWDSLAKRPKHRGNRQRQVIADGEAQWPKDEPA